MGVLEEAGFDVTGYETVTGCQEGSVKMEDQSDTCHESESGHRTGEVKKGNTEPPIHAVNAEIEEVSRGGSQSETGRISERVTPLVSSQSESLVGSQGSIEIMGEPVSVWSEKNAPSGLEAAVQASQIQRSSQWVGMDTRIATLQDSIVKQHAAIRKSGVPNFRGCRFPVRSALNVTFLENHLVEHGDRQLTELLRFGFPINYDGGELGDTKPINHKGARQFVAEVDRYIEKELRLGAIIGPFSSNPLDCEIKLNPLNTTPKRDSQERRVIVDLSFPKKASVNSGIDKGTYLGEPVKLKYPSVDSLVELVKSKGRGCALYKRDLKRAYRQIPIDPGDIHLLGFNGKGRCTWIFSYQWAFGLRPCVVRD